MTAPLLYAADRYAPSTLKRARRALRCAPFRLALYKSMYDHGVALAEVWGRAGIAAGFVIRPLPELTAEDELLWLITVGLLRREVDGQGITDSFRLTPLGRILVAEWQTVGAGWYDACNWFDRLLNTVQRWLRWQV